MRGIITIAVLFAVAGGLATLPAAAAAQARELHWKALDVDARLDADGALHVKERHHILFTGDWNGGERVFDLPRGQTIDLRGVTRVDAAGQEHPLEYGDLTRVDRYDHSSGSDSLTLRWRSRLPSDPPFAGTPLVYVIDYVLRGVLDPRGDAYLLEHDFAFERPSPIDALTVAMTIDPVWRVHGTLPEHWRASNLGANEALVVRAELSGNPKLRQRRDALQLILVAVPALLLLAFMWRERRRGRFARLPKASVTDPQWLAEHVFRHPPELVAVLWNRSAPGAHAVAALLARLELDAKIRTRVDGDQLQMQLLVDRSALSGYEREFIDGFFVAGDTTSTAAVRAHYKKSGFNPAKCLQAPLGERMRGLVGPFERWWVPIWLPVIVFLVGLGCVLIPPGDRGMHFLAAFLSGLHFAIGGCLLAYWWRRRLDFGLAHSAMFVVAALAPIIAAFAWLQFGPQFWPFAVLLGIVLVALAYFMFVLAFARTNEPPAGLALRRRLTACRRQLREELSNPAEFTESIVPYIFAFGLGKAAGEWFVRAQRDRMHTTARAGSSSYSPNQSSGGTPAPFTGGGGGFGGAGASGAWVSAVGAMSAGVSAPSSSSSGGSRGGGSRSGGGSAGGW